ncbi:MAG TPA: hypothetical protein VIY51_04075 [Xanthobacteraceae bacterium]
MTFCRVLSLAAVAATAFVHAANAQFGGMPGMPGMGSPGMGSPGFGGPPAGPPPACQQLMSLRDETQKNGAAIHAFTDKAAAQHKPPDPVETCKLFKAYLASHSKFIRGMTDGQATCGVPPDAIKAAQDEHGKVSQIGKQVCEMAEHPRPTGPSLSDALNSAPTLPDVDNSKRGRGTYDTLDGTNALVR